MSSEGALWDRLIGDVGRYGSALHCWAGDRYRSESWATLVADAAAMTAGLSRAGVGPGNRVAAVLTNSPQSIKGLLAVWLAGGVVASLPVPARGMAAGEYGKQLIAICEQLEPSAFLVDGDLLDLVPEELRELLGCKTWESYADSGRVSEAPVGDDDIAFIQYSSGSTRSPKGCSLTPRAITAQLEIISEMLDVRQGTDTVVSWIPLSHDMGLFGCMLNSLWNDLDFYLSTPERFIFSPGTWFSDIAEVGGTLTAGTNTSLYLGARAAGRSKMAGDGLSQLRNCVIAAEPVEWETLEFAAERLGLFGFRPSSLMPAYGLAEATLAVTATPAQERPRRLTVNSLALGDGDLIEVSADDPLVTSIVSAGAPCTGVSLPEVPTNRLGEIVVRSPSLAQGYWSDPVRTKHHFQQGKLRTGDLGFVRDGHLFPVGRMDDVLSVAGRKVYAREIESSVDRIDGVRRGCSTLVAHHDGSQPRLTLFIEPKNVDLDYVDMADAAATVAMSKAAVALDQCVFLNRGQLPKTPTGKIQRHRCRRLLEQNRFAPIATVSLGAI
jgi:fatty-acyl-CoA synthase